MKTTLRSLLAFCLLFSAVMSTAQTPFSGQCPGGGFAVLAPSGTTDPSDLYLVDESTVALTLVGNTNVNLNALVYNRFDNFLYAMSDPLLSGTPTLYQIGANGLSSAVTTIQPPTGGAIGAVGSFVGTLDENGTYYFPAIRVLGLFPLTYEFLIGSFDLNNIGGGPTIVPNYVTMQLDATCGTIIDNFVNAFISAVFLGNPLPSGGIQDWAINPNDGLIYSYLGIDGVVWKMDPSTGVVDCFTTTNPALTEFGAIFFDQNGNMKGIEVFAGNTWTVDVNCPGASCGTLTAATGFGGGLNGDAAACPFPPISLPVELIRFDAFSTADEIVLEWSTASEFQNNYFEIQKSTDGINFETIGRVDAAGTTQIEQAYSYIDNNPVKGKNYYRLEQVDFDGKTNLSEVQVVDFTGVDVISLTIFPNPAQTQVRIRMSQAFEQDTHVRLFNTLGQVVLSSEVSARQGFIDLDVSNLPKGAYILDLFDGARQATQKLVVE
ncbi:MAG: T9SS type A sorting domain-containing protein [Bacteroidota bacterium]